MPDAETINQRIKKRINAGYNQRQAAEALGLKTSTYSQMERKGNITTDMLLKLTVLFKTDERYLLFGEEHVAPKSDVEPKEKCDEKKTVKFGPEVDKEDLKRPPVYMCKGFEEDLVIMYRTVTGLKKRVMREVNYRLFKMKKIPTELIEYFNIDINK